MRAMLNRLITGALLLFLALLALSPIVAETKKEAGFGPGGARVRLYVHSEDRVRVLDLEEYLVGVVAAEMPAEFPEEALKAQAVAARTYIVKRLAAGGTANPAHPGGDICDDPRHGQAWLSREDLKKRWGTAAYYRYYYKVKGAVDATEGEVLVYGGQLIDPVYCASCGGKTENAGDVWAQSAPYLKSVPCPYDADPRPVSEVSLSLEEVDRALGTSISAVPAAARGGEGGAVIKVLERTATGRPKVLEIGGRRFLAVAVRDLLGLKSTNFTWRVEGGTVTFTATGHGHGVGLCQYGAKGMAEHGYDYRTILRHYYSGVEIERRRPKAVGT